MLYVFFLEKSSINKKIFVNQTFVLIYLQNWTTKVDGILF